MSPNIVYVFLLILTLFLLSVDPLTHDVYWRDYIPGEIPYDAIEAAPGRYIGQVQNDGSIVGTLYPHTANVVYIYYKRNTTAINIKILCSLKRDRLYWQNVDFDQPYNYQTNDAVKGGYVVSWDTNLFIGKTLQDGEWKIGMVFEKGHKWQGLWVWNESGETAWVKKFDILKYNSTAVESKSSSECGHKPIGLNASIWVSLTNP